MQAPFDEKIAITGKKSEKTKVLLCFTSGIDSKPKKAAIQKYITEHPDYRPVYLGKKDFFVQDDDKKSERLSMLTQSGEEKLSTLKDTLNGNTKIKILLTDLDVEDTMSQKFEKHQKHKINAEVNGYFVPDEQQIADTIDYLTNKSVKTKENLDDYNVSLLFEDVKFGKKLQKKLNEKSIFCSISCPKENSFIFFHKNGKKEYFNVPEKEYFNVLKKNNDLKFFYMKKNCLYSFFSLLILPLGVYSVISGSIPVAGSIPLVASIAILAFVPTVILISELILKKKFLNKNSENTVLLLPQNKDDSFLENQDEKNSIKAIKTYEKSIFLVLGTKESQDPLFKKYMEYNSHYKYIYIDQSDFALNGFSQKFENRMQDMKNSLGRNCKIKILGHGSSESQTLSSESIEKFSKENIANVIDFFCNDSVKTKQNVSLSDFSNHHLKISLSVCHGENFGTLLQGELQKKGIWCSISAAKKDAKTVIGTQKKYYKLQSLFVESNSEYDRETNKNYKVIIIPSSKNKYIVYPKSDKNSFFKNQSTLYKNDLFQDNPESIKWKILDIYDHKSGGVNAIKELVEKNPGVRDEIIYEVQRNSHSSDDILKRAIRNEDQEMIQFLKEKNILQKIIPTKSDSIMDAFRYCKKNSPKSQWIFSTLIQEFQKCSKCQEFLEKSWEPGTISRILCETIQEAIQETVLHPDNENFMDAVEILLKNSDLLKKEDFENISKNIISTSWHETSFPYRDLQPEEYEARNKIYEKVQNRMKKCFDCIESSSALCGGP